MENHQETIDQWPDQCAHQQKILQLWEVSHRYSQEIAPKQWSSLKKSRDTFRLNQDVPGFNSPIKKAALTLTLIKGPEVAGWVRDMGHWIDQLNPTLDNVPFVWEQLLLEFARQFHDSQQEDRARIKLENL